VSVHEVAAAYVRLEGEWLRRHGHPPAWRWRSPSCVPSASSHPPPT